MPKRDNISMSVIRRLPRYYRFLSELKDNGASAGSDSRAMDILWNSSITKSEIF